MLTYFHEKDYSRNVYQTILEEKNSEYEKGFLKSNAAASNLCSNDVVVKRTLSQIKSR